MSKKKDLILIGVLLAGALALYSFSTLMPKTDLAAKVADATLAPDAVEYVATPEPAADVTQAPAQGTAFGPAPRPQTQEIKGHVVLTVGGRQYGDPIAMDRDKIITLKQDDGKINKVHITPEKVYMESSTCDNQDCVNQGEITVDNYKTRVLTTWVICLPNNVSIEFVPAE